MLALDTETTGLDLRHGAKPYLVTVCDEDGSQQWWEWHVDPLTREPDVPKQDLVQIQEVIDDADSLVLQNPKFDVTALQTVFKVKLRWDWSKVYCTLLAGHLLASNSPHDLTSMALMYLGVDVQPYEDAIKQATKEARTLARKKYPDWRIAKKGLPEMPSAKETVWKIDMWLPRAVAKKEKFLSGFCTVVNQKTSEWDVDITRRGKWGNPFHIGKDGTREQVIAKYRKYVQKQPKLLEALCELDGKRLGCLCNPKDCHGDILQEFVAKQVHPWWTVCPDYANSDSETTLALFLRQRELLEERNLWRIYRERLKLPSILYAMEERGVTGNRSRLVEKREEYRTESERAGRVCVNIADSYGYDLQLPKGSNNNSLKHFVFGEDVVDEKMGLVGDRKTYIDLPVVSRSKKTGAPSLGKDELEEYKASLPRNSKQLSFIRALASKRKRDTALSYLDSYEKFWLPLQTDGWYRLHSSLNPTGTHTLRFSSSNPNQQQVSKQEETNLRYVFGAAPGREWWSLDAKNIELRIPAYIAGETEQINLFEKPDEPPYFGSNHLLVFSILHPDKWDHDDPDGLLKAKKKYAATWYQWVKNGNFAVQYGAVESSGTADRAYHVKGAQRRIQSRFREVKILNEKMIAHAEKHGYVETIPDKTVDPDRGYPLICPRTRWHKIEPTKPLNYWSQSTAMQWMTKGMIRVQEYLDEVNMRLLGGYYMVMQVHDELVFDFPKLVSRSDYSKVNRKTGEWKPLKELGNLPVVRKIQKLMEQGGSDIGIPTPVSVEYHAETWSEGVNV